MNRDGSAPPGHLVEFLRGSQSVVSVRVQPGETVLEAARRQGIPLPFGCLYGVCGTCTARLIEGRVTYRKPPRALKSHHLRSGYTLLCVALPTTDCRIQVGARIQAEMVPNPFKNRGPHVHGNGSSARVHGAS